MSRVKKILFWGGGILLLAVMLAMGVYIWSERIVHYDVEVRSGKPALVNGKAMRSWKELRKLVKDPHRINYHVRFRTFPGITVKDYAKAQGAFDCCGYMTGWLELGGGREIEIQSNYPGCYPFLSKDVCWLCMVGDGKLRFFTGVDSSDLMEDLEKNGKELFRIPVDGTEWISKFAAKLGQCQLNGKRFYLVCDGRMDFTPVLEMLKVVSQAGVKHVGLSVK